MGENGSKPLLWLWAGILLAILNTLIFNINMSDRPIGASTAFPYFSGLLAGLTDADYMKDIVRSGSWELYFLCGALIGSFLSSLISRDFKIQLIPERWRDVKGGSAAKRVFWAFLGGFLLLFGARLADGCTSGHILSGGMQLAVSSLVFGAVAIITFLITGKVFYRR
ncbi:MAG: YeeE/YedE thiosulfate transporter family protein [Desulfovibrionales bacterium]|nr:YeeE/YedE thiosulfate transporter family protein [Desulfovibrionales bacterium]